MHFLESVTEGFRRMWGDGRPDGVERRRNRRLREAIDRVVAGTDPRIRAIGGHGRSLAPAVERMLDYLDACAARLPPPIEMSAQGWRDTPLVRAFFATPGVLCEVFSRERALRAWFRDNPLCDEAYLLLGASRSEHKALGVELIGEVLRHDVEQIHVGFGGYSVEGVCGSEAELRGQVALKCFDLLVGECRERIVGQPVLEANLAIIAEVLGSPDRHLRLERVALRLDRLNVKAGGQDMTWEGAERKGAGEVAFIEMTVGGHPPRVAVLARFPGSELLPEKNLLDEARRLLGIAGPP